jgi:hypothetical protein
LCHFDEGKDRRRRNKWLQHEERDKVILEKLYYEDEETGKILPHKCH